MYSGVVNGQTTTFGTSGLLYRSNKVMYDRATRSLWNQFSGEPIIGTLADSGIQQPFFPSVVSTWGEWLEEHPDTTVLSRETDIYPPEFYVPEDDPRAIYYSYFTSDEVMFPVWLRDPIFEPKEVVVGITIQSASKAWRVADLQDIRLVNDTVGGVDIVIVASPDSRSGRVYERAGARFSIADNGEVSGPAVHPGRFHRTPLERHRTGVGQRRRSRRQIIAHPNHNLILVWVVPISPRNRDFRTTGLKHSVRSRLEIIPGVSLGNCYE